MMAWPLGACGIVLCARQRVVLNRLGWALALAAGSGCVTTLCRRHRSGLDLNAHLYVAVAVTSISQIQMLHL